MSRPRAPDEVRPGAPISWQRVANQGVGDLVLHGFSLHAGPDWQLAALCGRGPAVGIPTAMDELVLCPDCQAAADPGGDAEPRA